MPLDYPATQLVFAFLAYVIKKINNLAHGHEHKLLSPSGVNALGLPSNRFVPFWHNLSKKIDNFPMIHL